jgi:phage pi2 protein 07
MQNQLNGFEVLSSKEMENHNGGSFYYPISNYDGIYAAIEEGWDAFIDSFKEGYNKSRKGGGNL